MGAISCTADCIADCTHSNFDDREMGNWTELYSHWKTISCKTPSLVCNFVPLARLIFKNLHQVLRCFIFDFFSHFRDLKVKRDAYIQRLNGIYLNNLSKSNVELIRGEGAFVDKNLVAVGNDVYSADHILIAVGGYPTWPSIPGAEHGISSDGFFELETLPKKVIKGGGGLLKSETMFLVFNLWTKIIRTFSSIFGLSTLLFDWLFLFRQKKSILIKWTMDMWRAFFQKYPK